MAYRSISLIVTDEAADIGLLKAAVALAVRDGAHLEVSCLDVDATRLDPLPLGAAPMVVDFDRNHGPARGHADELAAWARKELDALAVPVHASVEAVVIADPGLDAGIARLLRYADLVIAGLPYGALRNSLRAAVIEAALFGTDAPVLVLPDRPVDLSRPFGRIMLGWNDTDVALSAARKALPFLQEAGHVDVVMVDPPSHSPERSDPGGQISIMLARHGVRPMVSILSRTLSRDSDVLLRFAHDHGLDAIVLGAYGHTRFREALMGGVTRELLSGSDLPLLMAH